VPCWPTVFLPFPTWLVSGRLSDQNARWSARSEARTNDLAWRERARRLDTTGREENKNCAPKALDLCFWAACGHHVFDRSASYWLTAYGAW
jgi:hypothetical protein